MLQPTLAWSVRNGRREGKDRLGIRYVEFDEAEAQPGGGEVVANLLQRQGLDFTQFGRAAETADDHITGLWLISGDFADHSDRPQRLTAGIAGGWRVYEHAIAT